LGTLWQQASPAAELTFTSGVWWRQREKLTAPSLVHGINFELPPGGESNLILPPESNCDYRAYPRVQNYRFHWLLFVAYPLPIVDTAMNRKLVWLLLTAILLVCINRADAQQPTKVARLGFLSGVSPSTNPARAEAFRQGLRELGYVEGKNIVIEWRYAKGKLDRLSELAAEVVISR
jgi:hypothetical protein